MLIGQKILLTGRNYGHEMHNTTYAQIQTLVYIWVDLLKSHPYAVILYSMCRGNFAISILFPYFFAKYITKLNETRVNCIRRVSRERRACAYELVLCVTYVRRKATYKWSAS